MLKACIKPQLEDYVQQIEAQRKQIDYLDLRAKELESQLRQNSRNSNYPSSMDKYKPKPAFPRVKGGKAEGKKGHYGGTLDSLLDSFAAYLQRHREAGYHREMYRNLVRFKVSGNQAADAGSKDPRATFQG